MKEISSSVTHVIRSAAVLAVALPITIATSLAIAQSSQKPEKTAQSVEISTLKDKLTLPCIKYQAAKADSKLERESKTAIDDVMGGDVVHSKVCGWAIN